MKKLLLLLSVMTILAGLIGTANADLLVSASLRDGNYGGGTTPDPYHPSNDPSQICPGIENSSNGVSYTSDKALINWNFAAAVADTLRYQGTISFTATFDSTKFTNSYPYLLSDNKGYNTWANGQSSFAAWAQRTSDNQISLAYKFWFGTYPNNWYFVPSQNNRLSFDQAHQIGFTWGGPDHAFEVWADGVRIISGDLPTGANFPWGSPWYGDPWFGISAANIGLGGDHQRGDAYQPVYGSAVGVTFADLEIWNEYRPMGGTGAVPLPPSVLLLGSGLVGLGAWRRLRKA